MISEAITPGLDRGGVSTKPSGIFYIGPLESTWEISKIGYICSKLAKSFEPEDTAVVCSNKGKVLVRDENATGKMVNKDNVMQGIRK